MTPLRLRPTLLATLAVALAAAPAAADPLGLRPLGGDWESARTVGPGGIVIEAGAWAPQFAPLDPESLSDDDRAVLARWQQLPAWPSLRGIYGLADGNEAVAHLGPIVGGGYRRHFLRAEAPWGGEYLQALIQLGGGFHLASYRPMGYIRLPAIYERGAWTFHVGPGGYYLFNQQPVVEVNLGMEVRPWPQLSLGGHLQSRMDAKKVTPMDGSWSFGGGVRYELFEKWTLQVEATQDSGPPMPEGTVLDPRIEFPLQAVRASATYYW